MSPQTSVTALFHVKQSGDRAAALLWKQAREWGINIEEEQIGILSRYAEILVGYELANVIGAQTRAEVLLEHVADAMTCFLTGQLGTGKRLVDVGTGGGLPGIPLQIISSGLHVTLLEATTKKAHFLESATRELGLSGTKVVNERAEEAGRRPSFRSMFDVAVTRAVGALPTVLEYSAPFIKTPGIVITMKGCPTDKELRAGDAAAQALGLKLKETIKVDFRPDMVQKDRTLLIYRKESETPNRFPRRPGLARKRPISDKGQK